MAYLSLQDGLVVWLTASPVATRLICTHQVITGLLHAEASDRGAKGVVASSAYMMTLLADLIMACVSLVFFFSECYFSKFSLQSLTHVLVAIVGVVLVDACACSAIPSDSGHSGTAFD